MSDKPWLTSYSEGVPSEIDPDCFGSLVELFEHSCKQFKELPAFSQFNHELTYAELDTKSLQFAAYLQQILKLKPKSRIAIMLPNVLQYPIVMFGALRAGLTVINVNPLYTAPELKHIIDDATVNAVVVLANFADTLQKAIAHTKDIQVIVSEFGDVFSWPKALLFNFAIKYIKRAVPRYNKSNIVTFKETLQQGKQVKFKAIEIKGDDIAYLQYTGGTTGVPKGSMLTHRNIVSNSEQCYAWLKNELGEGETIIAPLPLYHIFSLTVCCWVFQRIGGNCVLIADPRDIKSFIKILSNTKFSVLVGLNTLFNALSHHDDFANIDFSALKITVAGGMAMQRPVAERWHELTHSWVLEGYGLTETSPVVTINPLDISEFSGSIGLPIPSTDISIRDEQNKEVPLGEVGELCVKGPQVMKGYYNQPQEDEKVFTADGYLKTGDLATLDEKGYVRIVDRIKDMILVSGFNVYPNELEEVIASLPGVLEAAVVAVEDEESGEAVKAYVVKDDNDLTKEDIIKGCHQSLTNYKIPKYVEFRDSLPKSNIGKVLRKELR